MSNKIQTKMVAEALAQHTQNSKSTPRKMISALMSVCTSLTKPQHDLGFEQWRHIESKKSRFYENLDQQDWRSL